MYFWWSPQFTTFIRFFMLITVLESWPLLYGNPPSKLIILLTCLWNAFIDAIWFFHFHSFLLIFFKTSIQNGGFHHVSYIHGMWLLSFAHIRFLTDPPWHLLVMLWIQTVTCIISPFCLPPSCEPSGCPCTALLLHLIPARWPQALLPNREPEHSQSTVKTDLDIRSRASLSQVIKTFC